MRNIQVFVSFMLVYSTYTERNTRLRRNTADVDVQKLDVTSNVALRYAKVMMRIIMVNRKLADQIVAFQVRLPKEAYITGFFIITNNRTIKAETKEKKKAQEQYDKAKEDNVTAGLVSQQGVRDDLDVDIFQIEVNVATDTKVEFQLQYEEFLRRHAGRYTQSLFINSDHMIEALTVNCSFKEKQKFKSLSFKTPYNQQEISPDEGMMNEQGYYVKTLNWQHSDERAATDIPFEIEYELELDERGGIVFFNIDGDFIHLFSVPCDESRIMMKQIVFVIDISGSLSGNPISQVRQAMVSILSHLRSSDYFNIIIFDYIATMWKTKFQQANAENISVAKSFVQDRVKASGSTNINHALFQAIALFDNAEKHAGQIIVFLTDGSRTAGVTDTVAIRENIRAQNYIDGAKCCKSTLYIIAFGRNAALTFLQMIAYDNAGSLTLIKDTEDNSAYGKLVAMFQDVKNPYYKNLVFAFEVENKALPASNVTRTEFLQYDCGSEIVISGWTKPGEKVNPDVRVVGVQEDVTFNSIPTVLIQNEESVMLSRLVAYQWVKELLRKVETTTDAEIRNASNKKALELSLQYGFVTPLTSLVVTDFPTKEHDETLDYEEFQNTGIFQNVTRNAVNDVVSRSNCSTLRCYWSFHLILGVLSYFLCHAKA